MEYTPYTIKCACGACDDYIEIDRNPSPSGLRGLAIYEDGVGLSGTIVLPKWLGDKIIEAIRIHELGF
jgi:hypothetical protein